MSLSAERCFSEEWTAGQDKPGGETEWGSLWIAQEKGRRLDAVACNTIYHVCTITHMCIYNSMSHNMHTRADQCLKPPDPLPPLNWNTRATLFTSIPTWSPWSLERLWQGPTQLHSHCVSGPINYSACPSNIDKVISISPKQRGHIFFTVCLSSGRSSEKKDCTFFCNTCKHTPDYSLGFACFLPC